jgi:arabinan endo-1,5-alpha-L-arabinosidase
MEDRRFTLKGLAALGALGSLTSPAGAQNPAPLNITNIGAHDPVIIKQAGTYHVFHTGRGIPMLSSPDLINWKADDRVFAANPAWIAREVPTATDIWAPDISFRDGKYWLYYAVSTFGTNLSAIGLATNATLDRASSNYRWEDQGMVIKSETAPYDQPGAYNCIDPNYVMDAQGRSWLCFGSFWSGHKIFELDPKTGKALGGTPKLHHIAGRPTSDGGNFDRIEAPFIIHRSGWYYQFASYDSCCKGVDSSYYMVIGRSRSILGPYVDSKGRKMTDGYGDVVLQADREGKERWRGPGHNGYLQNDNGRDYIVYHAYDAQDNGRSKLRIAPVVWSAAGWPRIIV